MKSNINSYLFLLLSILLTACVKNVIDPIKHFREKSVQKIYPAKIVDLETFGILKPFNLLKINDSTFIIQDFKDKNIFNLINLSSRKVISGINRGQGPGEVLNFPASLQYKDGRILTHDFILKKMSEIFLSSDTTLAIKEIYRVGIDVPALFVMHQLDTTFIATGVTDVFENHWLAEMNKRGEVLSAIDYPMWEETESVRSNSTFPMLHTVEMASSPDHTKVIAATKQQGVISFLDRTVSGIKEYKQIKYHAPRFRVTERGSVVTSNVNIEGFRAVDCDGDFVYLLYSGRTINSYGEQFQNSEHLLVYDWEGNPVRRYVLDIPLARFRYDKETNSIYGLAENPEGVLIKYELSSCKINELTFEI
jgi:hypothetical protein